MKIGINETVLANVNYALMSTGLTFDSFGTVLGKMNNAGFYSVDCMNGTIFKSCITHLGENPWDRIRRIKEKMPNTKLRMSICGNKLFADKPYSDELVERVISNFIKCGIDIIKVHDDDNNFDNLKTVIETAKKTGTSVLCGICYKDDIVNFVELALEIEKMGADGVCITDKFGVLTPKSAFDVVKEIKENTNLSVSVNTKSSGLSSMIYLKSLEAGADSIDTSITSFTDFVSEPHTEVLNSALCELGYDTGIDKDILKDTNIIFGSIKNECIRSGFNIFESTTNSYDKNEPEIEFEKAKKELKNLIKCDEDVLTYIMFSKEAKKFFEERKIKEEHPVSYKIEII